MDRLEKLPAAKLLKSAAQSDEVESPDESVTIGSQIHLVIRIGLTVLFCEALVVTVVYLLPELPPGLKVLLDAGFMILLLSPVLYFAVLRPMVQQNYGAPARRRKIETPRGAARGLW